MSSPEVKTAPEQQAPTPSPEKDLGELSFTDYQRVRRGEVIEKPEPSALAAPSAEQKQSEESEPSETEAKEEKAKEAEAEESDEDLEAKDDEDEKDDKPKKKKGWSRRVEKLVAQREAERKRANDLESRLAALEAAGGQSKGKSEAAAKAVDSSKGNEPKPDDFETHSEYVKAVVKWDREQAEKAASEKAAKERLESEHTEKMQAHQKRVSAFIEKQSDFQEVVSDAVEDGATLSATLEGLLVESENGPELLYKLVQDRKELDRLNQLGPVAAARELGRYESKLEAQKPKATEEKPKQKLTTQAPKPIAPVGSSKGTPAVKSLDDPNLSYPEYERMRREQKKRRHG